MADERPQRDGKPLRGGHRAYSYPEIVVAYKHIDRVRQALDNAVPPIGHTLVDSDPDLGLGLISIENDVAAAWALHEHDPDWAEKIGATEEPTGPTEGDGPSTYLDSFLRGLRGYFAKTYAGWKPVVGKNRIVGPITTTPGTVWHGGGGPPRRREESSTNGPAMERPEWSSVSSTPRPGRIPGSVEPGPVPPTSC